ncbi:MAG: hypothetical protein CMM15_15195 [Rhodospirillaceae bacterium]|nr:hypothetical protein [Rhodospirillaceae bacterium]
MLSVKFYVIKNNCKKKKNKKKKYPLIKKSKMSAAIDLLKAKAPEYVKLVGANSDTKIKKLLFLYILAEAVLEAKASGTDFLGTFVRKYDPSMVTTEDGISRGPDNWDITSGPTPATKQEEYSYGDSVKTEVDAAGNPTGGTYIAKVVDGDTEYTFRLPLKLSKYHTPPPPPPDAVASGDVDECPSESESEDECSVKHFKM